MEIPERNCSDCGVTMLFHPAEYDDEKSILECPDCVREEEL